MNKKALYSILSTIVAMIVLSVSLVFAIGPKVSAAHVIEENIIVFDSWDNFNIDDNGVLYGLSDSAWDYLFEHNVYQSSGAFYWSGEGNEVKGISLVIPEGVKEIHDWAFGGDDGGSGCLITSVRFPNSLEKIGLHAFMECDQLTTVIIPSGVKEIEFDVFYRCGLVKIYCECSEEYANEHWDENWNRTMVYDEEKKFDVVWNYKAELTITFDSGVASQIIKNGENAVEPTAPTKDGYEFKGWLLNGEPYDFATPVTEDVTLTAKWEEVQSQPEPETPVEENTEVNNQNNAGLIWGIAGTSAGVLIIAGIVVGIVISKRRRK